MKYGRLKSVRLWQKIFSPTDEIWEAEYDKDCVDKARQVGQLEGIHTITGDQGNKDVLRTSRSAGVPLNHFTWVRRLMVST